MNSFWDFLWFFFWTYVFIAYLIVLFRIVADIFRDHALNGWLKAVWLIFLVFLPFITALVYLIARGAGMAERQPRRAYEYEGDADRYATDIAGPSGTSPAQDIADAKRLLDAGTITQGEFDALKARALR